MVCNTGISPKGVAGMANSTDPDQTLIWVCTICSELSVPILEFLMNTKILYPKFGLSRALVVHVYNDMMTWEWTDLNHLCINMYTANT